jgi:hypothetical protein
VDADYLADVLRVEGVVVALVASFLAAPYATRHLWERVKQRLGEARQLVGSLAKRLWRWLTGGARTVQVHPANMAFEGEAVMPVTASLTTSWTVNADDELTLRVERLERRMGEVNERVTMLDEKVQAEATERRKAIDALIERFSEDVQSVRDKLAAREQDALRVDATALPVIGLGIVLSGIPDFLAASTGLGVAAFITALAFMLRALVRFWADQSRV